MEAETVLMKFLYSITLKSTDLSYALNKSFTHAQGNSNSLSQAELSNFDTFHYAIPKFIPIATKFTRKVFKYRELVKLTVVDTNIPGF